MDCINNVDTDRGILDSLIHMKTFWSEEKISFCHFGQNVFNEQSPTKICCTQFQRLIFTKHSNILVSTNSRTWRVAKLISPRSHVCCAIRWRTSGRRAAHSTGHRVLRSERFPQGRQHAPPLPRAIMPPVNPELSSGSDSPPDATMDDHPSQMCHPSHPSHPSQMSQMSHPSHPSHTSQMSRWVRWVDESDESITQMRRMSRPVDSRHSHGLRRPSAGVPRYYVSRRW